MNCPYCDHIVDYYNDDVAILINCYICEYKALFKELHAFVEISMNGGPNLVICRSENYIYNYTWYGDAYILKQPMAFVSIKEAKDRISLLLNFK